MLLLFMTDQWGQHMDQSVVDRIADYLRLDMIYGAALTPAMCAEKWEGIKHIQICPCGKTIERVCHQLQIALARAGKLSTIIIDEAIPPKYVGQALASHIFSGIDHGGIQQGSHYHRTQHAIIRKFMIQTISLS